MKNKNIVVTGGAGFIGSTFVDTVLDNNKVTVIDNLSTGKISNISNLNHENLNIIEADLNDINLRDILSGKDYIFHFAAIASVAYSIREPEITFKNNVGSTERLIEAAVDCGVHKIVFSSSSAVYGDSENLPVCETEVLNPESPYAQSKIDCENLLVNAYENYGLNYTNLRYFNIYGPKQNKDSQYASVIPNFVNCILNGERPTIFGDGEQTRDFIYVKDIVNANLTASKNNFNGICNIASGKSITVNELFETIAKILDFKEEPNYLPERPGEIKYSEADISKMNKNNFKLQYTNMEDNLKETIDYFKKIL